jgi:putative tryptophan/tyrosine transport system substrate-binding protein
MRRRDFFTLLGGVAAAWPVAARSQQKRPIIGFLGPTTASAQSLLPAAFVQRLRELGWMEGRNVTMEYRWAEGQNDHFAAIAAEFARLNVDVIVTYGTAPVIAAKEATSVIPIVFAGVGDPVGSGLVASLARPGGNVTGLSSQQADTAGKRLELLREVVPGFLRLAILANAGSPIAVLDIDEVQTTARTIGLEVITFTIRSAEEIAPTFDALKGRADALYVVGEPLVNTNRVKINTFALSQRLPTIYPFPEYVEAGGLISYGANLQSLYRRAGDLVDKILRGTKPADIPVERPTKFDLVVNLTTAKAIGLEIPPMLLARADRVIE